MFDPLFFFIVTFPLQPVIRCHTNRTWDAFIVWFKRLQFIVVELRIYENAAINKIDSVVTNLLLRENDWLHCWQHIVRSTLIDCFLFRTFIFLSCNISISLGATWLDHPKVIDYISIQYWTSHRRIFSNGWHTTHHINPDKTSILWHFFRRGQLE